VSAGEVRFLVRFAANEGATAQVRAALDELVTAVRAEPGCLQYDAFSVEGGESFVMVERWESAAAAEEHTRGAAVRRYLDRTTGLRGPSELSKITPVVADAEAGDR
jgi:quinol monooxygenase YgiN